MPTDAKPVHPPPWKLVPEHGREYEGNNMGWIEDANGVVLCDFGDDTQYYPSEGRPPEGAAAALMLAAPELEAMLRAVTDGYEGLVRSDYEGSRGQIFGGMPGEILAARAILARLDAEGA